MPFHVVVKRGATIPDTLDLIVKAVNVYEHSPFVDRLTRQLNPTGSKEAFVRRLFDFVCKNVRYELDTPGDEEVWSPEKTVREGRGDCKKMTTLIASVLTNAGINVVLKHVYYDNELHTHIYPIVPFPDLKHYLTVDPVNHKQWNKEVEHKKASLHFLNGKKMDLHMMGKQPGQGKAHGYGHAPQHGAYQPWRAKGHFHSRSIPGAIHGVDDELADLAGIGAIGCAMNGAKEEILSQAMMGDFGITGLDEDEIISGIGIGRRKGKDKGAKRAKRKARRQKLFHVFKAVNLAPSRASFLLLVRSNIFKLANRMAKAWVHNPDALTKMWKQFGGDPNKLKQTIKAGSHKDPISKQIKGIGGIGTAPSVEQLELMETQGIGFPPAIAAAIAAATPLVLAVIKIIGKSKHDQDTGEESEGPSNAEILTNAANDSVQSYASSQGESTEGIGYMDDADEIVSGEDYDYIDGMGKKRKKDKSARKAKKAAKKAARKARKGKKKGEAGAEEEGKDGAEVDSGESYKGMSDQEETKQKRRVKLTDDDIKTLSTLAEYGSRKILKGQVTKEQINQMMPDESGTPDTPKAPPSAPEPDDISVPKITHQNAAIPDANVPQAGGIGFGISEINSLDTFLVWLKGALCIALWGAVGSVILSDIIIIGSLLYLTRNHITYYFKNLFTKKQ